MTGKQCFICGFDNEHALEEHHIIPESLNGEDSEENKEWLCANCHRAVSTMYSKWFFAKLWRKFDEMDTPPKLVRKNPPMAFGYDDQHNLVVEDEELFNEVLKAIRMYERGKPYREIISKTELSMGKVQQLDEHKELYLNHSDGKHTKYEKLDTYQ
jgi:hypothetical protein